MPGLIEHPCQWEVGLGQDIELAALIGRLHRYLSEFIEIAGGRKEAVAGPGLGNLEPGGVDHNRFHDILVFDRHRLTPDDHWFIRPAGRRSGWS